MKQEIKVPSLGESISEATIGQLLVPNGTVVKADAEVVELETDKVNQVLYAPQAGKITWNVKPGDTVKIGQIIGTIAGDAGQEKAAVKSEEAPPPVFAQVSEPAKPTLAPKASLRYTKEHFLADLHSEGCLQAVKVKSSIPKQEEQARETRRPLSRIRKVIAQRLVEAQQTMAMLTTFNEVDLTQVIQLREKYKETFIKKHGCKLGFMSFFVKATVAALQAFPDLNSYLEGDEIVHREYYDMGVAVGTEKGVIVPVIRDCDQLSFAEIEQALENYAKKAREGALAVSDLQGGGFTITNGGTYGSLLSTPILMPPQCGILGMHKIEKRPVVVNDQIVIRSMMYVALTYDHRLIDGKEAVSFLVHLKNMLEDPSRLLLDI
jgi:2-oxoglutarate dehydrogenase E2 component (dihydrolipoamide succinyltransferase)